MTIADVKDGSAISPDFASLMTECRLFTIDLEVLDNKIHYFCHKSVKLYSDLQQAREQVLTMEVPEPPVGFVETQLDINVSKPTHVFIRLNPHKNWRFTEKKSGMDLKEDQGTIDATYGAIEKIVAPGMSDCKIIYVPVIPPSRDYKDSFNFYVEVFDGGKVLPMIIDPDIKHPGGTE